MWILILTTLLTFAEQPPAPKELPEYDKFPQPIYSKMEQKTERPNEVNNSFLSEAAKISNDVNRYLRAKKDDLMKAQAEKRKAFEDAAKKELDAWRAANPKQSASDFMKAQGAKRKEMGEKFIEEKKELEASINEQKSKFEKFMAETKKDFRAKYNSYVEAMKLKEDPVKQEFKEIPKGPGTVLAPGKDKKQQ